jgi:hypothetical protein
MEKTVQLDKKFYVRVQCKGHPRADKNGFALEHILVYEQFHMCCVLSWGAIHHINQIKTDNRIENLLGMTKAEHTRLHMTIDMSDRKCTNCGSIETYKRRTDGRPNWYGSPTTGALLCMKCYNNEYNPIRRSKDGVRTNHF